MADASGTTTPIRVRRGAPAAVVIESFYSEPTSTWTPATIRCALDEHEAGRFYTSACLADAVMRDARVMRGLRRRVTKLASRSALPFKVEAAEGGDGRIREAVRARTEVLWWDAHDEATLAAILRDAILLGLGLGWVSWERTAGEWRPRLHYLPAHGLMWQPWDRRWTYTTREGELLDVRPGDGTWFLYLPFGEFSWMWGALRCVGLPFLMRQDAFVHWARFDERHASPMLKVKEPHFATDDVELPDGSTTTQANAFYAALRPGPNVAVRCPQGQGPDGGGWDVEWMELEGKSHEAIDAFIDRLSADIDLALLGSDSDGAAKGGDGELAAETMKVEDLATDAETLTTALREQVWKADVAFNYGPDKTDAAAWGRWTTRPAVDALKRAETLDKAGDAMGKLAPLGVDCTPVAAEFGLAAPGGVKAPPAPAAATSPAAPKSDDQEEAEAD